MCIPRAASVNIETYAVHLHDIDHSTRLLKYRHHHDFDAIQDRGA